MKKSIIYFTMLLLTACTSKEVQQSAGFVTIQGADLIQPYDEASNADNNIIFLNPGKYTVTYNASSGDITIVAQ